MEFSHLKMNFSYIKNVTAVSAISFLGVAPGYFRVEQIRSTDFNNVIYYSASGCAPANGDLLAEFCKQGTDADSDAFFTAVFS
jgi:hypothetical protein